MDVYVARSGGLAGLRLTWHVHVDEQPDRDDWYVLLEQLPWEAPPPAPPEPDRYVYRISCDPHETTLAEWQVTGPWRTLVDRVQERSEPERGRPTPPKPAPPKPTTPPPPPSSQRPRRDD